MSRDKKKVAHLDAGKKVSAYQADKSTTTKTEPIPKKKPK